MSEEEKKAIKVLVINPQIIADLDEELLYKMFEFEGQSIKELKEWAYKIVLNLIEKQQKEIENKECYMSQQDDEYSNWYICSKCHEDFYWGEEPDDMRRSNIKYCPFCGAKIGDVIFIENAFDEEE